MCTCPRYLQSRVNPEQLVTRDRRGGLVVTSGGQTLTVGVFPVGVAHLRNKALPPSTLTKYSRRSTETELNKRCDIGSSNPRDFEIDLSSILTHDSHSVYMCPRQRQTTKLSNTTDTVRSMPRLDIFFSEVPKFFAYPNTLLMSKQHENIRMDR